MPQISESEAIPRANLILLYPECFNTVFKFNGPGSFNFSTANAVPSDDNAYLLGTLFKRQEYICKKRR